MPIHRTSQAYSAAHAPMRAGSSVVRGSTDPEESTRFGAATAAGVQPDHTLGVRSGAMDTVPTHASSYSRLTEKPWGREVLLSPPGAPYVGKLLFVAAGHRLSLQWHDQKDESIAMLSGSATLVLQDDGGALAEIPMQPHTGYRVLPGRIHRLIAHEDSVFVEASTPEIGTTYRVQDDYGRSDGPAAAPPLP